MFRSQFLFFGFALSSNAVFFITCVCCAIGRSIAFPSSIRPSFPSGPDQLSIEEISLERPMDGRAVGRSLGTGAPFCPTAAAAIEVGGDDDGGDSDP